LDPRAGLDDMEKRKFLPPPGLEFRPLGRLSYKEANLERKMQITVNYPSSLSSMTSQHSQPPRKLRVPVYLKEGKRSAEDPEGSHTS
jgi:hypothetical protein